MSDWIYIILTTPLTISLLLTGLLLVYLATRLLKRPSIIIQAFAVFIGTSGLMAVASSGLGLPFALNNSMLGLLPSTQYSFEVARLGFAAIGDSPMQMYKPSASACSLNAGAGDGGSQVPSADGKCWLASFNGDGADIRQWGVKFDNTTDNSAPLQAAFNWFALGNKLILPAQPLPAKFLTGISVTLPNALTSATVQGAGSDLSVFNYATASGAALTINYQNLKNSTHLRQFSIWSGTAGGNTGILLQQSASFSSSNFGATEVYDVSLAGSDGRFSTNYFTTGINVIGVDQINLGQVSYYGPAGFGGNGIAFSNSTAVCCAAAFNVHGAQILNAGNGIVLGQYAQGFTMTQSNIGATFGVNISSSGVAQVAISSSQFVGGEAMHVANCAYQTYFTNNEVYINTGQIGLEIQDDCGAAIIGNTFQPQTTSGSGTGILITATHINSPPSRIIGNELYRLDTGVKLDSGSAGVVMNSNVWVGNTTDFINNAGGANNIGQASLLSMTSNGAGVAANTTTYVGTGANTSNESQVGVLMPAGAYIDRLTVFSPSAPGVGLTDTFTFRCASADTPLTTTFSGNAQSFNQDITHGYLASNGTLCDLKAVLPAAAAVNTLAASVRVGMNY